MFCPQCRLEYRPGFTSCSDCEVELVEGLSPPNAQDPDLDLNNRPDRAPRRFFFAWFLPMCVYVVCFFGLWVRPRLSENLYFVLPLVLLHITSTFGSFWMLYQAVRYEKRVGRYVLLAFVPFLFVWYSMVRVPLRKEFQEKPDFIR